MHRKEEMSFSERIYLPQILVGLAVTGFRFWRNLGLHILHRFGMAQETKAAVTVQYPEERKIYPETFRGRHRLTLKDDGSVKCTACFLCATACPASCILIEAGEHPDETVEKFPIRYEIDTLRCIYCALCVEACPCDAIRMDTGLNPAIPGHTRKDFVETKEILIQRSKDLEAMGRDGLYREHQKKYAQS